LNRNWFLKAAVVFVTVMACSRGSKPGPAPQPINGFDGAVSAADKRVSSGDYAGADRILADYALKSKGTPDATEISFYRALYMVDPQNKSSSVDEGIRALNIYLSSPGARRFRSEAIILRRTAQTLQSLRTVTQAPKVIGRDTVFITREDEIAALKDQLAKANAELERIKKRLANPSKLD
jgi:hypothetical protein